jgi:hypothetical protein
MATCQFLWTAYTLLFHPPMYQSHWLVQSYCAQLGCAHMWHHLSTYCSLSPGIRRHVTEVSIVGGSQDGTEGKDRKPHLSSKTPQPRSLFVQGKGQGGSYEHSQPRDLDSVLGSLSFCCHLLVNPEQLTTVLGFNILTNKVGICTY